MRRRDLNLHCCTPQKYRKAFRHRRISRYLHVSVPIRSESVPSPDPRYIPPQTVFSSRLNGNVLRQSISFLRKDLPSHNPDPRRLLCRIGRRNVISYNLDSHRPVPQNQISLICRKGIQPDIIGSAVIEKSLFSEELIVFVPEGSKTTLP